MVRGKMLVKLDQIHSLTKKWLEAHRKSKHFARMETLLAETKTAYRQTLALMPVDTRGSASPGLDYGAYLQKNGVIKTLELIAAANQLLDPDRYIFVTKSELERKAKELKYAIPKQHNNYGATIGGPWVEQEVSRSEKAYMWVSENWVTQWLAQGDVGNVVTTIRHEYQHVRQHHDKAFLMEHSGLGGTAPAEADAYLAEIARFVSLIRNGQIDALPDDQRIQEALFNFVQEARSTGMLRSEHKKSLEQVDEMFRLSAKGLPPARAILLVVSRKLYERRYGKLDKSHFVEPESDSEESGGIGEEVDESTRKVREGYEEI